MTDGDFIKRLTKLAEELARDASYIDCHNFTEYENRQTLFVQNESAESCKRASDLIYRLVAEYYAEKKENCPYSYKVNCIVKQMKSRVLSI